MATVTAELHADWYVASQLLQEGKYQQVAELLPTIQASAQAENPLLALLVGSVQQICLACWQCHADHEWHQQASSAAQSREEILRHQAQSILSGISAQPTPESGDTLVAPEVPITTPETTTHRPKRWSQMRGLLHQVKQLFSGEEESEPLAADMASLPVASAEPLPSAVEPDLTPESITVTEITEPAAPAPLVLPPAEPEPEPENEPLLPTPPSTPPGAEEFIAPIVLAEATPAPAVMLEPAVVARAAHDLVFCYLGSFRVYQQDQLIEEWNGLKGQMILKYLAVQRGAPVTKDRLMDIFWPDSEPEAARRNLHQAIYSLRQTLRRRDPTRQHIHFENNQYLLNPELSVWVDSDEFAAQVQTGRRLEAAGEVALAMTAYSHAEALYQGDFLLEDPYEEWPRGQREHLRTLYLEIADRLSEHHLQQGGYAVSSALCQKILALDSCFEAAHRRLMRCYLAQGQRHLAIRQYHTCVQALAHELDVPPDGETQALYASITAQAAK